MIVKVPSFTVAAVPPSDDTYFAFSGNFTIYLLLPEEKCPWFSISKLIVACTVVAVADGDCSSYLTFGVVVTTCAPVLIVKFETICPR